jgi:hypothetical protein
VVGGPECGASTSAAKNMAKSAANRALNMRADHRKT